MTRLTWFVAGVERSYFLFADTFDPNVDGAYIYSGGFEGQIGTQKSAAEVKQAVMVKGILFAGFVCIKVS